MYAQLFRYCWSRFLIATSIFVKFELLGLFFLWVGLKYEF